MAARDRPSPGPAADQGPGLASRGPFRIHAVAELTGVPEPTLRAWERRYGIPSPERTASGYRLYSAQEVEQVREMRRLSEGGMAASEAAKLLISGPSAPGSRVQVQADPYAATVEALLDAIDRFDDASLDVQLRKLMFLGSTTTLLDRVVVPVLREVGRRWHRREISVAQEHLASQQLGTLLRDMLRLQPGADSGDRVLLACFADDDHELGLLGTATRLSGWGLRPIFLGARTPPGAIREAVAVASPVLVALSVTMTPNLARARELVDDYASACGDVPWIVGGSGVHEIADMIRAKGGVVAPEDASALRAVVRMAVDGGTDSSPPRPRKRKL
jgi:DNA-binding transcriptional MerR regulator